MKKIILSLSIIAVVAIAGTYATVSYFSDTETSTGNTFTAGSIDLKVDSECHYYVMDDSGQYVDQAEVINGVSVCTNKDNVEFGGWSETDLEDGVHKFFNISDVKPGDWGEDTVSLHVYDNDAWGKMIITATSDTGNNCTEPETEDTNDSDCYGTSTNATELDGELRENTKFSLWLDQGSIPGFQNCDTSGGCSSDPYEGDNIWQPEYEPLLSGVIPMGYTDNYSNYWWYGNISDGIIEIGDEVHNIWEALAATYDHSICTNSQYSADGDNAYGTCHGLAEDGRMVGSTTYYFGFAWQIPYEVGNEAQSDGFTGDVKFEVVQHRNNPNQVF